MNNLQNVLTALDLATATARNLSMDLQSAVAAAAEAAAQPPPPPVLRTVVADTAGKEDATVFFQEQLDGTGVVYVPAGLYLIDPFLSVNLRSGTIIILHPDAILTAKPNPLPRYDIIKGENASNIQIIGGNVIGDRFAHDYSSGGTHEHGMGLRLRRCSNVVVRDLVLQDCTGDGISASGEDLSFRKVSCLRNRRQGLSLYSGRNYEVIGGSYSNTGDFTNGGMLFAGAKPKSGIDIEPDAGDVYDVRIDGVEFSKNQTAGLLVWSRTVAASEIRNVRVTNCGFSNNANGINASSPSGRAVEVDATRNRFYRNTGSAVRSETDALVVVGNGDPADANNIVGMTTREAFTKEGIATKFDLMQVNGGRIVAGINNYA